MGYKLHKFEILTPGGRRILVKAKSRRTLDRRLSRDERENCLIHRVSETGESEEEWLDRELTLSRIECEA